MAVGPGRVTWLLGFCIVEVYHLILEYILNKCGNVIHFDAHFLLYFFANDLLLAYFIFILDYKNDVNKKQT